jgi:hypothetical protein
MVFESIICKGKPEARIRYEKRVENLKDKNLE